MFDRPTKTRAVCEDSVVRTVTFTGEADTFFTRPGKVSAHGKTVSGFVSKFDADLHPDVVAALDEEPPECQFTATGKHRHALSVWNDGRSFKVKLNEYNSAFSKPWVTPCALIQYTETLESWDKGEVTHTATARVIGLALRDGLGKEYAEPTFEVLRLSDDMRTAYYRHVGIGDVERVLDHEKGVEMLMDFFGPGFRPERARRLAELGAYSRDYYDNVGDPTCKQCGVTSILVAHGKHTCD
jgi:hypothetical protein